ncbi:MAG: magnesium transporter [Candidatus Aenigmatarchaeota archaeon]
MRKYFNEIFFSEFLSITGGLLAGLLLANYIDELMLIPGMFIMIPGFLEMRGNISGSLAARLGAALHMKFLKPRISARQRILKSNVAAAVALSVIIGLSLGVISFLFGYALFGISSTKIIFVGVAAAILSNVIEIPLTVFSVFWLFKHGHDPDNVMGPYTTTIGDILSVVSLLLAIIIIG